MQTIFYFKFIRSKTSKINFCAHQNSYSILFISRFAHENCRVSWILCIISTFIFIIFNLLEVKVKVAKVILELLISNLFANPHWLNKSKRHLRLDFIPTKEKRKWIKRKQHIYRTIQYMCCKCTVMCCNYAHITHYSTCAA